MRSGLVHSQITIRHAISSFHHPVLDNFIFTTDYTTIRLHPILISQNIKEEFHYQFASHNSRQFLAKRARLLAKVYTFTSAVISPRSNLKC